MLFRSAGRITTTYGDYVINTAYDEATPTPGSNSPNSMQFARPAGGATPGAVTHDVDLAAGDQGQYASVNVLAVGSWRDNSTE